MANSRASQIECRELDDPGKMLRCFRERMPWSQEELASRSGVSLNSISEFERGRRARMHPSTFALLAEALRLSPEDQAALRSAGKPRGKPATAVSALPLPVTSFLGRELAVASICRILPKHVGRMLTLMGTGGIGKTRIALRAAEELAASFAEGVYFVDLANVADPRLVPGAIAQALGFLTPGGQPVEEALIDYCASRQLLLVLDNFEHVLDAADYANRLLGECPKVFALVTSREPLQLQRERLHRVEAMTLPETGAELVAVERSEAVQLFVERAGAVRDDFKLTAENAEDVATICVGLDGLPLAIELAAAQMIHVSSAASLRSLLREPLTHLKSGLRDQAARHRTMRDAIAWSYRALSPEDQALFRRLAVFAGGFTTDMVESVVRDERGGEAALDGALADEVFARISSLAAKNLLQLYDAPDGGTRYRMLETIREFGLEQLEEAGEAPAVRASHSRTFRDLVEQGERELTGPLQNAWMSRLETEFDNVRGALTWAIDSQDAETGMRMGSALWRFWAASGRIEEGKRLMSQAVALPGEVPPEVRAKALRRLGNICFELADYRDARSHFEASLSLAHKIGDLALEARAAASLGLVALNQGDYATATEFLVGSLPQLDYLGLDSERAVSYQLLGEVAFARGDFQAAHDSYATSLELRQARGDRIGEAYSLFWLGQLDRFQGRFELAAKRLREALKIFRSANERFGEGSACFELAMVAHGEGNRSDALALMQVAFGCRRELGTLQEMYETFEGIALLTGQQYPLTEAIQLLAAASHWRSKRGICAFSPIDAALNELRGSMLHQTQASHFTALWDASSMLTLSELLRIATAVLAKTGEYQSASPRQGAVNSSPPYNPTTVSPSR